ncbi:hypothetical protein SYNPS1DRAFT_27496 [Syncephalis pseudoplumigaleata]|uniref:histidine kinase n=1 Tax=Syncephalis pseudoplumigaleata TaxID=1712513 RepID=A0A4P9Z2R1_9FUNG|nr:hypothetical protein SYNPS1DRAFT_27496 [Syncephalis pseudoplumigaleata]|eukprot:RKP26827.1 hypothetical protein SYNPS1DRAFT_27496 [Syncephalis pseudoplumigaleata]
MEDTVVSPSDPPDTTMIGVHAPPTSNGRDDPSASEAAQPSPPRSSSSSSAASSSPRHRHRRRSKAKTAPRTLKKKEAAAATAAEEELTTFLSHTITESPSLLPTIAPAALSADPMSATDAVLGGHSRRVAMATTDLSQCPQDDTTTTTTSGVSHARDKAAVAAHAAIDAEGLLTAATTPLTSANLAKIPSTLSGALTAVALAAERCSGADTCSEVTDGDREPPLPELSGSPWLVDDDGDDVDDGDIMSASALEEPARKTFHANYYWTTESQLRRFRRKLYLRTRNLLIGSDPLEIGPTRFVRQQVTRSFAFFVPLMMLVHFVLFTNSFYLILYELVICLVTAALFGLVRRYRAICHQHLQQQQQQQHNINGNSAPRMTRQNSHPSGHNRPAAKQRSSRASLGDRKRSLVVDEDAATDADADAHAHAQHVSWSHRLVQWTQWHPFRHIPTSNQLIPVTCMFTLVIWLLEIQRDVVGFGMLSMLVAPITMSLIGPWASLSITAALMGEVIWFHHRWQLAQRRMATTAATFIDFGAVNAQYGATIRLMLGAKHGRCPNPLQMRGDAIVGASIYAMAADDWSFRRSDDGLLLYRALWMLFLAWVSSAIVLFTHRRCYRRLIRSYRQAKGAAREKSRLVSQVAHELRTPLSAVLGWTELLLNEADSDLSGIGIEAGSVHEARVAEKFRQNSDHLDALAMHTRPPVSASATATACPDTFATHDEPRPPLSWPRRSTTAMAPPPPPPPPPSAPPAIASTSAIVNDTTTTTTGHANTHATAPHISFESARADSLRLVHTASRHLMCILNDILDVGKIGAGKMSLLSEDFDLHSLAVDTCHIMSGLGAKKGLEMILEYPRHVPTLFRGDPGRIRQVLSNLVSNAIKYTEQGYIRVSIQEEGYTENGLTRILCEVDDSGVGIPESLQNKLFAEFSQCGFHGEGPTPAGTGLGLFLVKQLTELMGGNVSFRSNPGTGSTFGFRIPLEQRSPPPMSPTQQPHPDSISSFHTAASASGPLGFLPSFLHDCLTPGGTRTYTYIDTGLHHCAFYVFSRGQHFRDYLESLCTNAWHADSCTTMHESRNALGQMQISIPRPADHGPDETSDAADDESNDAMALLLSQERRDQFDRHPQRSIFLIDLGSSPGVRGDRHYHGACTPTSSTAVCAMSTHSIDTELDTDDLLEAVQRALLERADERAAAAAASASYGDATEAHEERDTVVLLYSFGQASRVTVPPQLAAIADVSVCRKPVTERELLLLVRRPLSHTRRHAEGFGKHIPKRTLSPSRLQIPTHRLRARFDDGQAGTTDAPIAPADNAAAHEQQSDADEHAATAAHSLPASPLSPTIHTSVEASSERRAHHTDDSTATTATTATDLLLNGADDKQTNGEFNLHRTLSRPPFDELRTRLQQQLLKDPSDTDTRASSDAYHDVVAWMADLSESPAPATDGEDMPTSTKANAAASTGGLARPDDADADDGKNAKQAAMADSLPKKKRRSELAAWPYNGHGNTARHAVSAVTSPAPMPPSHVQRDIRYQGRVLVVDDNSINRSLLTRQLELLGVQTIESAANGEEACAKFQPGYYHLVLMDVRMPRMDGYTAARVMREKESSFIHDTASVIPLSNASTATSTSTTTPDNAVVGKQHGEQHKRSKRPSSASIHGHCAHTHHQPHPAIQWHHGAPNKAKPIGLLHRVISKAVKTQKLSPNDVDDRGYAYGGVILAWMDVCAGTSANRFAGTPCVTASVDAVHFISPVRMSDVAILTAVVNRSWRTSFEVGYAAATSSSSSLLMDVNDTR